MLACLIASPSHTACNLSVPCSAGLGCWQHLRLMKEEIGCLVQPVWSSSLPSCVEIGRWQGIAFATSGLYWLAVVVAELRTSVDKGVQQVLKHLLVFA
jgi:hypothetical protein